MSVDVVGPLWFIFLIGAFFFLLAGYAGAEAKAMDKPKPELNMTVGEFEEKMIEDPEMNNPYSITILHFTVVPIQLGYEDGYRYPRLLGSLAFALPLITMWWYGKQIIHFVRWQL